MNRTFLTILAATLAASACGQITISNAVLSGVSGNDGSGLTNLNASELKTGIIPMGRVAINAATNGNVLTSDGTNRSWGTVPLAALPSGVVTNGHSAAMTFSNTVTVIGDIAQTGTNRVTKIRVGGASETSDAVNVTGTSRFSSTIRLIGDVYFGSVYGNGGSGGLLKSTAAGNLVMQNNAGTEGADLFTGSITATNGAYYLQGTNTAPTAAQIGGTVGSVTNHLIKNVGGALIDYWSDGTTLWSKQLAP